MSNLFRKKSLDRISSPEQLNEYIRVSTPSVWILLAAIVILLAGVCVWGVFGHMDTTITVAVEAKDGTAIAYVRQADVEKMAPGMTVTAGDKVGKVLDIGVEPVRVDDEFTDYMRHVGGLKEGEWVYAVTLEIACAPGVHEGEIVIDSVSPMSFVLN